MKYFAIIIAVLCLSACGNPEYTAALNNCDTLQFVQKDACLQSVAIEFTTNAPCTKIRQSGVRIPCTVALAISTCDKSVCEQIAEAWQQPNCELQVESASQCAQTN